MTARRSRLFRNSDEELRRLERAALASRAPSDWWAFQAERLRQGQPVVWDLGTWVGVYRADVVIVTPVRGVAVVDGSTFGQDALAALAAERPGMRTVPGRWFVIAAQRRPGDAEHWSFDGEFYGSPSFMDSDRSSADARAALEAEWRISFALDRAGLIAYPPYMPRPASPRTEPVS